MGKRYEVLLIPSLEDLLRLYRNNPTLASSTLWLQSHIMDHLDRPGAATTQEFMEAIALDNS